MGHRHNRRRSRPRSQRRPDAFSGILKSAIATDFTYSARFATPSSSSNSTKHPRPSPHHSPTPSAPAWTGTDEARACRSAIDVVRFLFDGELDYE